MKLLKKFFILTLSMVICFSIPFSIFAQSTTTTDTVKEYLEDGSYIVTEFEQSITPFSSGTVSKVKTATYYNSDDERQWSVSIKGTFTYTGSSATCTSASTSYKIYDSAWKVTQATATRSGRTATGEFIVKKYWLGIITKTIPIKVVATCDNNGNVS